VEFRTLPVTPDEGLPQRFAVAIGGRNYEIALYAQVKAAPEDPPEHVYDLAPLERPVAATSAPGFLVLRIDRRDAEGERTILLRKLVADPGLVHDAEELAVVLKEARIARGNLNGRGRLGTRIVIGVAARWE
jgi:hypothetical protein